MKEMSKQGLKSWSPKLRSKVYKKVFPIACVKQVHVSEICSKNKIGEWAYNNLWDGTFVMLGYSHAKTRTHVALKAMCKFRLSIGEGGKYSFHMLKNYRLFRYWFWRDKNRRCKQ